MPCFLALFLCLFFIRPASGADAQPVSAAPQQPMGLPSTLIELDGTLSNSPDGGKLVYEWKQLSGPKVELSDYTAAKPYFRTSQPGTYEFQLVVEANGLKSQPHLVRLEIERENLPPVAKLPPEIWGQVGDVLEIDGRQSFDPEGANLTYRWRPLSRDLKIPPAVLGQPVLMFEPTLDGMFEIELVVSDGEKVSHPVVTRVGIKPRPKPPVAKVQVKTLKSPAPATAPTRDISAMSPPAGAFSPGEDEWFGASSPDDRPLSDVPAESVRPPLAGTPAPTPDMLTDVVPAGSRALPRPSSARPAAPAGSGGAPAAASRPPPVARIDGPVVAKAGDMVMLDARSAWSPAGNRLEYFWRQKSGPFINDFELVFDGAAERFRAPRPGDYEFELVVADGGLDSVPVVHKLRVVKEEDPPVAVVVAPTRSMPGALVKMDATQSYDMAGSKLVYRWRQTGGPPVKNYVIDETLGDAAPAFHPPTSGVYSFELIVSNGKLNSKPVEVDIEVGDSRLPPSLIIMGPEVANNGERLFWEAGLGEGDVRGFTFEWRQNAGPANAALQGQGRRVMIMPPVPGRYVFEVSAIANGKTVATVERTLEVFKNNAVSAPPQQSLPAAGGGTPYPLTGAPPPRRAPRLTDTR